MEKLGQIDVATLEAEIDANPQVDIETIFVEIQQVAQENLRIIAKCKNIPSDDINGSTSVSLLVLEAEASYKEAFDRLVRKLKQRNANQQHIAMLEALEVSLASKLAELRNTVPVPAKDFSTYLNLHEGPILVNLCEMETMHLYNQNHIGQMALKDYLSSVLTDDPQPHTVIIIGGVVVAVILSGGIVAGAAAAGWESVIGLPIAALAGDSMITGFAANTPPSQSFKDVIGEKDTITELDYSEDDTFALMQGLAESIGFDSKDWYLRNGQKGLETSSNYINHLIKYESTEAREKDNMGKGDVIDATAKYIDITTEDDLKLFRGWDRDLYALMETVLGREMVKSEREIVSGDELTCPAIAKLEGQILGKLVAAYKRFNGNTVKFKYYKSYVFYRLNNLPGTDPLLRLDQVADCILPPSSWETEVMAYMSQHP